MVLTARVRRGAQILVKNTNSLYLLAQCLLRAGRIEACYKLLSIGGYDTPELRFLFARCCYELNKLVIIHAGIFLWAVGTQVDEAENVLRANNEARLHPSFEGSIVEPFARAQLAKIFIETGRTDEAKRENRRAINQNIFSWSSIRTQCELGASRDIDEIYEQFSWKIGAKKSGSKTDFLQTESSKQTSSEKNLNDEDKNTPIVSEAERKISCFAPKKKSHLNASRKIVHGSRHLSEPGGGVEPRRSTRLFPSSQDSENVSTLSLMARELRASSRSQHAALSPGSTSRTVHDKQLSILHSTELNSRLNLFCMLMTASGCRSMNRINEMEANSVAIKVPRPSPSSAPSIHKLIESPDSDSSTKPISTVSRRTRSGSQSAASPLADKNAQLKDDVESSAITLLPSNPQISVSGEAPTRTTPVVTSDSKRSECETCNHCTTSLTLNPFSVADTQSKSSVWSDDMSLLFLTKKVLERVNSMPARFAETPLVRELAARAYLERLEYNKSRELLESLHKQFPYRVSGMEVLSTVLWHSQESRQLSLLASELTESARANPETWCVAGNCFSVQKQPDIAIECFERAISLNPRFAYAYSLLGHELLDTDQLEKATSAFRRAVLLCPIDYRAWFGLGLMHFKRECLHLARSYLVRAVHINPYNSVVLCQLSVIEQALHNDLAAMDLLQRALKITPENAACRFYRARLLYEKHEYEKCRDELNELKLYAHDEAQVFFLLGRVYKKLGNTHMALLNFNWAAEMDPRGEQSHNSLAEGPYDDEPTSD
ncbi:unnamed protein product [Anisakis simplex]|uniref:Cell division cycle protein 27 homolog n=1 Tax=Anisakis simplex TaxID=6269 RepID=A0A0M3JS07_ANISI|nr:unnamed protein product [Anisakis simplex]